MLRIISTLGFVATAFLSIFMVYLGDSFLLWGIVLLVSWLFWFYLVGNPIQFKLSEFVGLVVVGTIGTFLFFVLQSAGIMSCFITVWNFVSVFYLIMFWGSAAIGVWKVLATIASILDSERYNDRYLGQLQKPIPGWKWAFALYGILFLIGMTIRVSSTLPF